MQTVLIVDDQPLTRLILTDFVATIGPNILGKAFAAPLAALDWVREHAVDLAIVDYRMPEMNGVEFTRRIRALPGCEGMPVMITAVDDPDHMIRHKALAAGVVEFLTKPIDHAEWLARCRNILALCERRNRERVCEEVTGVLFRVVETLHGRNPKRLAGISWLIAEQIGLSAVECDLIGRAAPLNDLGYLGVPCALLSRPSTLQQAERATVQQHTLVGFQLLQGDNSAFLKKAARIALSHHERFDGHGYPHGFRGCDIPLEARIVSVADIVDALLSDRPYRRAWSLDRVLGYLKSRRGTRFDPDCVDAFFQRLEEGLSSDNGQIADLLSA